MKNKMFKAKQKLPKEKWYYMVYLLFERFKTKYKVDENLYKFSLPVLETENVNVELLREEVFQMYQLASKKRREKYRYNFKKDQFIISVTTFFWSFIFYLSIFFFIIFLVLNFLKLETNISLENLSKYKFQNNNTRINDLLFWYNDTFEEEEESVENSEEITRIGFFRDQEESLDFESILDKLGASDYLKTVLFTFIELPKLYLKDLFFFDSWKIDEVNLVVEYREKYLDYFLNNFKSQFFYLFPSFFSEYWKFKYLNTILKPKKVDSNLNKNQDQDQDLIFFLDKNMFSWLLYQTRVYWSLWNYYIRSILNTSLTNLEDRKASYIKYYIRHLSWNLNWISLITKNKFALQELFYKKIIFSFSLFIIKWCVLPINYLSNLFININSHFFLQSYIGIKFLYYGFYIRNETIKNFFLSINDFFLSIIKFFFKFIKIDFPILDLKLKTLYKLSFLLDFLELNLGSNLFGFTAMDNNNNNNNNNDLFNILLEKYKDLSLEDILKKNQYKFTDFVDLIEVDKEAFDDSFFDFNLKKYEINIRNLQQLEKTFFYKNKEKRLFLNNIDIVDAIKNEYLHTDVLFKRMYFTLTDELPVQFENTEEVSNSVLGFYYPEICALLENSEKEENNIRKFLRKYYLHQGFDKYEKKWWTQDVDAYGHDLFYLVRSLVNKKISKGKGLSSLDKDYFYFASMDERRVLRKIYLKLWRYRNFYISNSFLRTIIKKWIMYRNSFMKDSKFLLKKNNFFFPENQFSSNKSYWLQVKFFLISKIDFVLLQFLPYRYYQFNHFIKSFVFPFFNFSFKREISMFDHFRFFGNFIIFNLVSLKFLIVCIFFIFIIFLSYYKLENYRTKMDWKVYPFYVRDLHKFNISEKRWLDEMDFYLTVKELKDKDKQNDNL